MPSSVTKGKRANSTYPAQKAVKKRKKALPEYAYTFKSYDANTNTDTENSSLKSSLLTLGRRIEYLAYIVASYALYLAISIQRSTVNSKRPLRVSLSRMSTLSRFRCSINGCTRANYCRRNRNAFPSMISQLC